MKYLCASLPYGVIVDIKYNKEHGSSDRLRICSEGYRVLNTDVLGLYIQDEIYLKPYLRPLSSMTEEERKELFEIEDNMQFHSNSVYSPDRFDFYTRKHFDYRGLIEKGLALEAPEEMYKPYKLPPVGSGLWEMYNSINLKNE